MFIKKINNKNLKIGIIGLGYVGLPRAMQFCAKKFTVYGFDTDSDKINTLRSGKSYIINVKNSIIKKSIKNKIFIPTSNFSLIGNLDVILICVPTPLDNRLNPNLKFINGTIKKIKKNLKKNQLICLESTSYPGTTFETIVSKLSNKFKIGKNFFVGYSPERNDPALKDLNINKIPKLVSGFSKKCLNLTNMIYKIAFKETVVMNSMRLAEMTKLYENIYRAINIGFVNEMKMVCTKMNLNINEIIRAAKTKPFGFKAFYPGPGLGGHCIPIDPFYLTWKAKQFDIKTEFINLAGKVNRSIPSWVVGQLKKKLKERRNILTLKKRSFLILGVAYKKNINDCRESPAFEIIKILEKNKAKVDYNDPFIPSIPKLRNYNFNKQSIKLNTKSLKKYDAVILVTDHDKFNYKMISKNSKLIIDTRHVFDQKIKNVVYS